MLLQNRQFCAHFDNKRSKWHKQKNGLPQGSVLAPMLFNIFTSDWSLTAARKFVYVDDMCLAAQSTDRTSIETTLTEDLSKIAEYCKAHSYINYKMKKPLNGYLAGARHTKSKYDCENN